MPSPRRAHTALPFAVAFLCAAALACSKSGGDKSKQDEQKKREPARVRVAAAEQREMVRTISTTTVVESENEVKLFPRTAGVALSVAVEEGDAVAAGALLAELDARDKQAMIDEARVAVREAEDAIKKAQILEREAAARIESARFTYEQALRDYERNEKAGLISQVALDAMRLARDTRQSEHQSALLVAERSVVETKAAATALERAKLSLETRELERSHMRITAPFAGVIAQRMIRAGDAVGPGAPVFVLTDADNLRAILHRPQRELDLFALGLRKKSDATNRALEIRATAEALPDLVFQGEIQRISPSIDASSGSFRVTVKLDPAPQGSTEKRLLPGMLVRIEVVTDRHADALVVPKRALRREGEVDLLFVARGGRAQRVEVSEGYSDDDSVEVTVLQGELARGDLVIVVGNRELEQGSEVELEQEKHAPPSAPDSVTEPAAAPADSSGTTPASTSSTAKG
jgi:RND family efflux transporter MFP subunit